MPSSLQQVLAILSAHQEELRDLGVERLAVFGSLAKNYATPASDVDVLVEFERPVDIFEFLGVKDYLEGLLGRRVDLVTRRALRPEMREEILAEAVYAP